MNIYAHSVPSSQDFNDWEPLDEHLLLVASYAEKFAQVLGLGKIGSLMGVLHDIGKSSDEFQLYLKQSNEGKVVPKKVNHSWAGAQQIIKDTDSLNTQAKMLAVCLAYVISGHHSGLMDGNNGDFINIEDKIRNTSIPNFLTPDCVSEYINSDYLMSTSNDLIKVLQNSFSKQDYENQSLTMQSHTFEISMLIRMMYSCLVDADFLATEEFMNPIQASQRVFLDSSQTLDQMLHSYENKLNEFQEKATDTPLNFWRRYISEQCKGAAGQFPGFFSLTVPTGGGKTLASLRFALHHVAVHQKARIIYVIPYTSIIEQTAATFRSFFDHQFDEHILEHHSNIPSSSGLDECSYQEKMARLRTENWDSPLIVTTAVQFFESLFASKSSKNRKLHHIANSVIILDEAQLLPLEYMKACLFSLNSLTHYGASVVLCTATQPPLNQRQTFPFGLKNVREILNFESKEESSQFEQAFHRVKVSWLGESSEPITLADLAKELANHPQCLCIINNKRLVKQLTIELQSLADGSDDSAPYHLSTNMCASHRTATLNKIRQNLSEGKKCRVISTSLVEAGVDLDFPIVFKALDGLDSIAQAAGRCNREGRLSQIGHTYIFRLKDHFPPVGKMKSAQQVTLQVIEIHPESDNYIDSTLVDEYFTRYFDHQISIMDQKAIFSEYNQLSPCLPVSMNQIGSIQYKTMDERFKLINEDMQAILIPWNQHAIDMLNLLKVEYQVSEQKRLWRNLQPYIVSVRKNDLDYLKKSGVLETLHDSFLALYPEFIDSQSSYYDSIYGLKTFDDSSDTQYQGLYM